MEFVVYIPFVAMSYSDNKVTGIRFSDLVDSLEYPLNRLFGVSIYKKWAVYFYSQQNGKGIFLVSSMSCVLII